MRLQYKPSTEGLTRFYQFEIIPFLGDNEFKVLSTWGKVDINGQDIILQDRTPICKGTYQECEHVVENKTAERRSKGYEIVDANRNP